MDDHALRLVWERSPWSCNVFVFYNSPRSSSAWALLRLTPRSVVVDRILETEDCHFVTRWCRPIALERSPCDTHQSVALKCNPQAEGDTDPRAWVGMRWPSSGRQRTTHGSIAEQFCAVFCLFWWTRNSPKADICNSFSIGPMPESDA